MKHALKVCIPFFLLFTLATFWVGQNAFFWDTLLQASKQGHFFFEHHFSRLILPPALDAGHPPFFALYLALIWTFFGKSLIVSHLAMLPFLFGIIWQLYRFARYFFDQKHIFWVIMIVCSNVTFIGQSSLVSPDIVLLFFFLSAVNGIFYKKKWQIIVGSVGMSLLSIRAVVLIVAICIYQLYLLWLEFKRFSLKNMAAVLVGYFPVVLVIGSYYTYHFFQTGWWLSTPHEAWNAHREMASFLGLLKNIAVLGWRLMDYGFVSVFIVLTGVVFWLWKKRYIIDLKIRKLAALPLLVLLMLLPLFLLLNNPVAHRYLMPVMIPLSTLIGYLILETNIGKRWQPILIGFILLVQISGNFWVYPRHIAQGWDSTLAHLPYYELRTKMITYLDDHQIPLNQTGTEFPMIGPVKYLDLSERTDGFKEKDMEKDRYIVYSNVFNDFSDEALSQLDTDFIIVKTFKKGQIEMVLYERKNN